MNILKVIPAIFMLLFSCGANATSHAWYPPEHPDDFNLASEEMAKRSVIKIVSAWNEGETEVGAGIMLDYIENSLFFVTASHVIFNQDLGTADSIEIKFQSELVSTRRAKVYRYNERHDIAVIVLPGFYEEKHLNQIVKLPIDLSFNFGRNLPVKTLGHPNDREWYISSGTTKPIQNATQMGIESKLAQNGNSGGPVLSQNNKIIAMVVEGEGERQGYALKMEAIMQILDDWRVPYRMRIAGDIAQNLRPIRRAIWDQEIDQLKGTALPDHYIVKRWKSRYSVSGSGNAKILEFISKTIYIEHLGHYGSAATLDEAWRLWVREISSALTQESGIRVKTSGKYNIHFMKYGTDTWLARLSDAKMNFQIIEDFGDLYLVAFYFENDLVHDLSGLLRDYFKD